MRLTNHIPEPDTAADLFMSRYKWLSRWAMQFARNDKGTAEELIQDTYLRFSQADLNIRDIRDTEALLYTYLEYVHLAHLREVARHSFASLAEAKLDALALGLPNGPDVNRIETQNTLRRTAAYVAWRKQTSKSASIVALRFFHGYLPEEIALIARVSRSAVDERLHQGRSEIRLHLLDAQRMRTLQRGGPAEIFPAKFAVSTDELLDELHNQLFYSRHGACVPAHQVEALYRKAKDAPLQRDRLAHIVSCRNCLAAVAKTLWPSDHRGKPGSNGGVVTMKRHGPRSDRDPLLATDMKDILRRSERRQKEIFEHRPNSLIVAVNGEVLASRDTTASFNGLKVEVSTWDLRFIEVLNEYGISLLSLAVDATPRPSDPIIHRTTDFGAGRRLEVDLQFSAQKLVIEVQYHDPSFWHSRSASFALLDTISFEESEDDLQAVPAQTKGAKAATFVHNLLDSWSGARLTPSTATAFACTILLAIFSIFELHRFSRIKPVELLQLAARSERQAVQSAKPGIIYQQVRIRSSEGLLDRSTYHDPEGKHRPKKQPIDGKLLRLKIRLAKAGIDWDAPLSATSFNEWRGHNHIRAESVQSLSGERLRLQADINGSEVGQETITLRASDFHLIGRTVEFRDRETVEIAEINYAVVPWATLNQDLFESGDGESSAVIAPLPPMPLPQHRIALSEEELVVTELKVRTALHESRADSTDRITVSRGPTGVQVSGVIEDEEQKSAVKRRLYLIPHVSMNLAVASDAREHEDVPNVAPSVQVVSVVAEPSLLEAFLLKQGTVPKVSSDVSDRLFAASTLLLRANKALSQLKEQFHRGMLSPNAANLYDSLLVSWQGELDTALREEAEAIHLTRIEIAPAETRASRSVNMDAEIETNRRLLKELIGHSAQHPRAAPVVLTELAHSVESLREAANEENERVSQAKSSTLPRVNDARP